MSGVVFSIHSTAVCRDLERIIPLASDPGRSGADAMIEDASVGGEIQHTPAGAAKGLHNLLEHLVGAIRRPEEVVTG
jgi:hypothetical protein